MWNNRKLVFLALLLGGCALAPPSFVTKEKAMYFGEATHQKNYQELFRCFLNTAPMPFVDGGDKYWQERIFSEVGVAEFQVGIGQIYYTLIEFKKMSSSQTAVKIWSQYSSEDQTGHLGLHYFKFIKECSE